MDPFVPPDFLSRARLEAGRYGSDPWVFVRELLQNARDAGARRVAFDVAAEAGKERVACRDDGSGMTFAHARRYLFRLYASSKEGEGRSAGRFGVGFWSVLRFEPARLVIRSWPPGGEPWEVTLDGDLRRATWAAPPFERPGTEVVMERPAREPDLPRRVFEAVWHTARYLRQRDHPARRLHVTVNGRSANAAFELPPPSALFHRGRARGVVALASVPGVELFSKGLRVRSGAFLPDLLAPAPSAGSTAGFAALGEGVAPRALLESDELELLLARSDARDDRSLRRLVRLAGRELERLVERQLDEVRPRPFWRRAAEAMRGWTVSAAAVALAGAIALGLWLRGREVPLAPATTPARLAAEPAGGAFVPMTTAPSSIMAPPPSVAAYQDLDDAYAGPSVEPLERGPGPVAVRYRPEGARPYLAVLLLERPERRDRAAMPAKPMPYRGDPCTAGCLQLELTVEGGPGPLRLPVPTGHRVDPSSVRLDDERVEVSATPRDETVIALASGRRARLRYRTGPDRLPGPPPPPASPALPAPAARLAAELRALPLSARAPRAALWVQRAVAYSTAPDVVARYHRLEAGGVPFFERAVATGAGDCDVQNAVLTLLLQAAGVPARLAIGFVGDGHGGVTPWLHAWVEYREGTAPWRALDASEGAPGLGLPATVPVSAAAAPAPVTAPLASSATARTGPAWVWAGLGLALGVGAGALVFGRTKRVLRVDADQDLARLLRGALLHPDGFGPRSAVFHRPLVPLVFGGAVPLARAWDLAARGRLYATESPTRFAREAARHGFCVLDTTQAEGRAVAEALGAVDLDVWETLVARSRATPLLDALDAHLRRQGEDWSARIAPGLAPSPTVLRLPAPGRPRRLVLVDADEPWLREAQARRTTRPAEALFAVADRLAAALDLPAGRRARLLAPLARAALREATAR